MSTHVEEKRPAEVGATGIGGGLAVVVIAILNYLGWERTPEIDGAIVAIVAWIAGPIWARIKGWRGGMGVAGALVLCTALLAGSMTGCAKYRIIHPDGTIEEGVDMDKTVALYQAAMGAAEMALNLYQTAVEMERSSDEWTEADQAEYDREIARQQAQIDRWREIIDALMDRSDE